MNIFRTDFDKKYGECKNSEHELIPYNYYSHESVIYRKYFISLYAGSDKMKFRQYKKTRVSLFCLRATFKCLNGF